MATISAKLKDDPKTVSVEYDFPEDLDGLVEKFGHEVVYNKAMDSLTIDVQALVRRHMKGTEKTPAKSEEEIQRIVSAWVPGTAGTRKSPVDKVSSLISKMSPEEKAALLASLRE